MSSTRETAAFPRTACGRCGHESDDVEPVSPCPGDDCPGLMWVGGDAR